MSLTSQKRKALVYLAAALVFGCLGVYFSYPIPCSKFGPSALVVGSLYGFLSLVACLGWAKSDHSLQSWLSTVLALTITGGICAFVAALLLRDPSLVCSAA